jgi:hypothetical protein
MVVSRYCLVVLRIATLVASTRIMISRASSGDAFSGKLARNGEDSSSTFAAVELAHDALARFGSQMPSRGCNGLSCVLIDFTAKPADLDPGRSAPARSRYPRKKPTGGSSMTDIHRQVVIMV